ncbi:MAG: DUF5615 family PIN-like protein [Thermomicrobiales bacterium]
MTRFLLDANLLPQTSAFLRSNFGLDVVDLISSAQGHLPDVEVVAIAKSEGRTIITFDLDLGEIYHRQERGNLGVIILRLEDQTVESVNEVLSRFFRAYLNTIPFDRSLVVVENDRVRIRSEP